MKIIFNIILFFLFLCNIAFASINTGTNHKNKIKIAFLNSMLFKSSLQNKSAEVFFNNFFDFMGYAAKSLEIDFKILNIIDNNDDDSFKESIRDCISEFQPDVFVFFGFIHSGKKIIEFCEKEHIPSFIVNTAFFEADKMGKPREKYKYWIGEMLPDDEYAGYMLAKKLIEEGSRLKKGKIHMMGMTIPFPGTQFKNRIQGLQRAVKESKNVVLDQIFTCSFTDLNVTKEKFHYIKKIRYPEILLVWAASDTIALGIIEEAKEMNLTLGKDIITGGIDWTEGGLKAVKNSDMAISMGGHFMEGAWVAILLCDYFNGKDFAYELVQFKSEMLPADKNNVNILSDKFSRDNWQNIDFKKFSKTYNPQLKKYNFKLNYLLNQLN